MAKQIQKGLVSTIIPVFNRPEMIVNAVNSVLSQDYRPIEIIVIDDGSTDDTSKVLKAMDSQYSELTVLTQKNSGPGVARELGRQQASGEFLQYLDSDDVLLPNKFSLQVSALNADSDMDVAYGKTERIKIGAQRQYKAWKQTAKKNNSMFPEFLCQRWWGTSSPLYRSEVTDIAGAWLPLINEEDWEYDTRIASLGGKLSFVNEFVSIQYYHDEHLSDQGSVDPLKLSHRCKARHEIYQNALNYEDQFQIKLSSEYWMLFSKSAFHLARLCVDAKQKRESQKMIELSIQVCKDQNKPCRKQLVYRAILNTAGLTITSLLNRIVESVK